MPDSDSQIVKPPALRPGDTIGIIAPASNVKAEELNAGAEALRRAGYQTVYLDSILDRDLYFAGSVDRRVREFEEMFARDDVRAIVCARGGYGANYLLSKINFDRIVTHPKIFVGYSDLTCFLTSFTDAGLVTFHGPMVAKDWAHKDGVDLHSWQSALSQSRTYDVALNSGGTALAEGEAEGVLYGGCLSILVASLGTPYEIKTAGKILFIEDIAAKPYQIDRMLMQLKLGGHFENVRGLIFGEMLDCRQAPNQDYTLPEVIKRIVADLGIPVAFGLKSGHVSNHNITLPFGVRAKLSVAASGVSLRIEESSVSISS
ncbi:MAG TPA: LD-carboxypeptidase [Candidatus Sulfotelmatobacter sp.]|nr:LD-carboxypeptidase [Candidatus Sulfotelmatobacter sp.]